MEYEVIKAMYQIRFAVPEDVPACVAMSPTTFACFDEQSRRAWRRFLHGLLAQGRALLVVVVDEVDQPIAFGASMFISDKFRQSLIQHPYPLMGQTVRLWAGRGDILTARSILRAHRGQGLNLLGFYGWRVDLPPKSLTIVQHLLRMSFPLLHGGYHLRSFLKEVYGERELKVYTQAGCTVYKTADKYGTLHTHQPYLVGAERSTVRFPWRIADLFRVGAPQIKLTGQQRTIVQLNYILRLTNVQIAECLERSVNTIYVHWNRIGKRLNAHGSQSGNPLSRTGQKTVINYIASHPEVIYPLSIHTLFYHRPVLARQYPIPLAEGLPSAAVMPSPAEPAYHPDS